MALTYQRERGLTAVIVRLFNTVGPRQSGRYGMVFPCFVRQVLSDAPIAVYEDGLRSNCLPDLLDVARGLIPSSRYPRALGQGFKVGTP